MIKEYINTEIEKCEKTYIENGNNMLKLVIKRS